MHLQALLAAATIALLAMPAHAQYCREFTKRILVGGKFQQGYGTSCLMPDGSWKITENANLREASPVNFFYTPPAVNYVAPYPVAQQSYYPSRSNVTIHYSSGESYWGRNIWGGSTHVYGPSCARRGHDHGWRRGHGWGHYKRHHHGHW
jgi:hypothetical protein